jgi:hypothetical protein
MSNSVPCAICVTPAHKAVAEAVLTAYRGQQVAFDIPLVSASPAPGEEDTIVAWALFDGTTQLDHVSVYLNLPNGDLPPLFYADSGAAWGVDGLPTSTEALTATSGANMQVYPVSGEVVPVAFFDGVLAGRGEIIQPSDI